ncbi:MAG: hypothetical protein A2355_16035 [Spirochaetes bacterium RIFOXYB1_FULL_32_8]|nr:MAG: hypothetical protein A2355_16035 [Spirochaetes bacterium RIFOXYB1_FULL_32_8]
MKQFKALIIDETGKKRQIIEDGVSKELFIENLNSRNYYIIQVSEAISGQGGNKKLEKKTLFQLDIVYQIYSLLDFGIDVNEVFNILRGVYTKGNRYLFVNTVYESLNKGVSFSDSIKHADQYGLFNDFFYIMVRAGESSGKLTYAFLLLHKYLESMNKIKDKVISALIYPLILIVFSFISLNALFLFIIPNFKQVYANMDYEPAFIIRTLFGLSDFIIQYYFLLNIVSVVIIGIVILLYNNKNYKKYIVRFFNSLPVMKSIGVLRNKIKIAFCLEIFLKGGYTLEDSLYNLTNIEKDGALKKQLAEVFDVIKGGVGLRSAFSKIDLFNNDKDLSIIEISEAVSKSAEGFEKINNDALLKLENYTENLLKFIEPVMMLLIGAFIFMIMYMVISPTLEILNKY